MKKKSQQMNKQLRKKSQNNIFKKKSKGDLDYPAIIKLINFQKVKIEGKEILIPHHR